MMESILQEDECEGDVLMKKKTLVWLVLALFTVALGIAGCGGEKKADNAGKKVVRVGAEMTFPPFEFQDEKSKDYVGFDMDLARALAKEMGMELEIQSMGFDALIPALDSGTIDMIASGVSITPERQQKVAFSAPYYKSGLSILVKNENTTIKNFKDLEGKKIAVQIGTTSAEEARKIPGAVVREFNGVPETFMELKAGGVDAVVNDLPVNQYYLGQFEKKGDAFAKLATTELKNAEDYGIAVAKKNTELAGKVNKALETLKANGEYDKLYQKWFGKKQ